MAKISIRRDARLPDDLRIARALSAPHLGPRILFFSGGSALNGISRKLKSYTFNSIHLITPFDSGGSSQVLRETFDMPAVGDLRSRLMALADETELGQPDIFALFSHRLPKEADQRSSEHVMKSLVEGQHPLIKQIAQPMRMLIQSSLQTFFQAAPKDFDYRNASIGNLILAGGYLGNERLLEPMLFLMSKMVDVRGTVRAVADVNLQIGVDLADGARIISQRAFSGKEAEPIRQAVKRVFLSDGTSEVPPKDVPLPKRNLNLIDQADLICFPPGSLFSSVAANLLPSGVGQAVFARDVPKIYVPSLGCDPEAYGLSLADQVEALLAPMRADLGKKVQANQLITHVVCDTGYDEAQCRDVQKQHDIFCHRLPLVGADPNRYDHQRLCEILVSMT